LSSRNRQLDEEGRKLAPALYEALQEVQRQVAAGGTDVATIKAVAAKLIPPHPQLRLEYLELVDPEEMQPIVQVTAPARAAGALWVGSTRLIDNVLCVPPPAAS
jgi:pantoate--beta-alanine ligase